MSSNGPKRVANLPIQAAYSLKELKVHSKAVPAYLEEPGVASDSVTETYAALKLYIENWRWESVPFNVQTGKNMPKNQTIIAICFKHSSKPTPERLTLTIACLNRSRDIIKLISGAKKHPAILKWLAGDQLPIVVPIGSETTKAYLDESTCLGV